MPTQQASVGDNVIYRNAKGKTRSGLVTAVTPQPGIVIGLAATPSASGGTLAAGTVGYSIAAVDNSVVGIAGAEVTATVPAGGTGSVALTWNAISGADSYNVYGRTAGGETLLKNVATNSYTDTGADTPSGSGGTPAFGGALATINTHDSHVTPFTSVVVQTSLNGSTPQYMKRVGNPAGYPRAVRS